MIFGRDDELAWFDDLWNRSLGAPGPQARGCAVVLRGPRGVGKRALVREACARIAARGHDLALLVVPPPPRREEQRPGKPGWLAAVEAQAGDPADLADRALDAVPSALDFLKDQLPAPLSWVPALLRQLKSLDDAAASAWARDSWAAWSADPSPWDSLWTLLDRLSASRPVVLVFLDAERLDAAAEDFVLKYNVRRQDKGARVWTVLLRNSEGADPAALVESVGRDPALGGSPVEARRLDPLTREAAAAWLAEWARPRAVAPDATDFVLAAGAGLPALMEDLLRAGWGGAGSPFELDVDGRWILRRGDPPLLPKVVLDHADGKLARLWESARGRDLFGWTPEDLRTLFRSAALQGDVFAPAFCGPFPGLKMLEVQERVRRIFGAGGLERLEPLRSAGGELDLWRLPDVLTRLWLLQGMAADARRDWARCSLGAVGAAKLAGYDVPPSVERSLAWLAGRPALVQACDARIAREDSVHLYPARLRYAEEAFATAAPDQHRDLAYLLLLWAEQGSVSAPFEVQLAFADAAIELIPVPVAADFFRWELERFRGLALHGLGRKAQGRRVLRQAFESARDPHTRVRILLAQLPRTADDGEIRELAEACARLAGSLGEKNALAKSKVALLELHTRREDEAAYERVRREIRELNSELRDPELDLHLGSAEAEWAARAGDLERSRRLWVECVALAVRLGRVWEEARSRTQLGVVEARRGDRFEAILQLQQADELYKFQGTLKAAGRAWTLLWLGHLHAMNGHLQAASTFLRDCLQVCKELSVPDLAAKAAEKLQWIEQHPEEDLPPEWIQL